MQKLQKLCKALGWEYGPLKFHKRSTKSGDAKEAGKTKEAAWDAKFAEYAAQFP